MTYAVVFALLVLVGSVFAAAAVAGKIPRGTPRAEVARRIEAFVMSPDGVMALSLLGSVTLFVVALVAGATAPEGLLRRLRLGSTPLSGLQVLLMLVGMLAISEAMSSLVDIGWSGKGTLGTLAGAIRRCSGPSFLALVIVIGLFTPVAEEVFFRGFIQTRLAGRFGAWPGILITAFLFGLVHFDAIHTPQAVVGGVYLGWVALASRSVLVAVLLHAANNVAAVVLTAYLPDPTPAGSVVAFGLSVAVAGAALWRLQTLPAPLSPEACVPRGKPAALSSRPTSRDQAARPAVRYADVIAPAVVLESPVASKAPAVGWATCPHCQLRHSRRNEGRCPRCSQAVDSMPRPITATPDYVLEDAGRKELNAIRVLMLLVGVFAIAANWHARSSAVERVFDGANAFARELRTSGDAGERAARRSGLSLWRNPGKAISVTRRLALVGMGLGAAFLVCAARAGRRPFAATITALALYSGAHLVFWAVDPLGGNAFFGRIDMSEPNLSGVMKVLVAIVLIKAVHTATEYQKAIDFHRANAS